MCSATQCGFLVRRSNDDVVERFGRRSLIGPGKPYWKTPVGFTGGVISLRNGVGSGAGFGGGGDVEVATLPLGGYPSVGVTVGDSLR